MPAACGLCAEKIGYRDDVRCSACNNPFHVECVRARTLELSGGEATAAQFDAENWLCPGCVAVADKRRLLQAGFPRDPDVQRPGSHSDGLPLHGAVSSPLQLTTQHFEEIMKQFSLLNVAVMDCNNKIAESHQMFVKHEEMLESCNREISSLRDENTELRGRIASFQGQLDSFSSGDVFAEVKERIERERNVMVVGVPESIDDNHDTKFINEVFSTLVNMPGNGILSVVRVGKQVASSPRLLKVSLSTMDLKRDLLRNRSRLRGGRFKNVFIKPDLSRQQLVKLKHLRGELRNRRARGEINVTIMYRNGEPMIGSTTRTSSADQSEAGSKAAATGIRAASHISHHPNTVSAEALKRLRDEDDSPKREQGIKMTNQAPDS